jgi:5'(3')-deoxyribonucleotidase
MKKILFDMDGVLVDLGAEFERQYQAVPSLREKYKGCPDHIPGVFRDPPAYKGAIEAVKKLAESGKYELFIATAAPWGNPCASTDKRYWIEKHFGQLFHKRMIVTHRKDLLIGDYLIDDRTANGAGEFKGKHIHFGWDYENGKWNEYPDWDSVLKILL